MKMNAKIYEGHIKHGRVLLLEALDLPEGRLVYVVVPDTKGTAIDPSPFQVMADIQLALSEFSHGEIFEIQSADDLLELIQQF
jgi:hypothetical protein